MREIGIYVHIPYCASKCKYCSFVSSVNRASMDDYVSRLLEEIDSGKTDDLVTSVYVGGGTPSVLKNGQICSILAKIRQNFTLSEDCEITVEANPESASDQFFAECKQSGVNRLSIGLQCADDEILRSVGRAHSVSQFNSAVIRARQHGFNNISGDLIIGLEGESREILSSSLALMAGHKLEHISVYSLSVEKGCVMYLKSYRPDEDEMADDYDYCSDFLRGAGYDRYEISNFSLPGKQSRHNNKYWTGVDYLGFGVSAHSCYQGVRFANTSSLAGYLRGQTVVERQALTKQDLTTEFIMLGLRLSDGISLTDYYDRFGVRLEETRSSEINKLVAAGVIAVVEDRLFVTDKGAYVLNYVITELI